MLNDIMLSIIMPNVITMSAVVLNGIMLSVLLNGIMLSVVMLGVIVLSLVMLNGICLLSLCQMFLLLASFRRISKGRIITLAMVVMFSTASRTSSISGNGADSTDEHGDNVSSPLLTTQQLSRNGLRAVRTQEAAIWSQ
jgi:hypothetical protein